MKALELKENWNIAKGKLKQKFSHQADEDLGFEDGKIDELTGRVQKRTGRTKEEIEKAYDECCGDEM